MWSKKVVELRLQVLRFGLPQFSSWIWIRWDPDLDQKITKLCILIKGGTSAINSYVCIITAEVLTKIAYAHRWHEMPGMFASVSSKRSSYDVTKKLGRGNRKLHKHSRISFLVFYPNVPLVAKLKLVRNSFIKM